MIHVENLTKYYNEFCAVDRISVDIHKGEVLGLLGPNGAGKTTTLRMLTGYFMPTSGTIRVKDYLLDENLLEIKKLIGYLPESAPLYHNMLVFDYLDYVAGIRGLDKDQRAFRIRQLVDLCGLGEIMHRSINELSKGLNQRVGLAHAMMTDPEILILDEPTSGLDPNQIVEIREIIRKIGEEKADDHVENLKQTAGQKHFIHLELLNADFQKVCHGLNGIQGIENTEQIDETPGGSLKVRLACESAVDLRETIYQTIKQTSWVLIGFHQETKTLENIFRELTKED
ncbi:MAG: ATP-binding cassette domain-containing protein [Deltaproteobacteria bacterium]|nr:ATP-binding cassette domain-containing protein [Deltaproteobacteria bacterium]